MKERKVTQVQLAQKAGISQSTISRLLNETADAKLSDLAAVSVFFGVRAGCFLDSSVPVESLSPNKQESKSHLEEKLLEAFDLESLPTEQLLKTFEYLAGQRNQAPDYVQPFYMAAVAIIQSELGRRLSIGSTAPLTEESEFRNVAPEMNPSLKQVLARVNKLTASKGAKAALAERLKVPQSRLSEWLTGKYEPSGELALKLYYGAYDPKRGKK